MASRASPRSTASPRPRGGLRRAGAARRGGAVLVRTLVRGVHAAGLLRAAARMDVVTDPDGAVAALLDVLADEQTPVLLVIDDVHHAAGAGVARCSPTWRCPCPSRTGCCCWAAGSPRRCAASSATAAPWWSTPRSSR